jgi:hypothetical protein
MYGALSGVRVRDVGKGLTSWQRFQSSMTRLPRWLPRRRLRGALCELGGCASKGWPGGACTSKSTGGGASMPAEKEGDE